MAEIEPKQDTGVGEELITGLENAICYAKGDKRRAKAHRFSPPARIDVKRIRSKLGMTQDSFAGRFGISTATLRNWEQGRRRPEGPARALLTIIDQEPEAVKRAFGAE